MAPILLLLVALAAECVLMRADLAAEVRDTWRVWCHGRGAG